MSGARSGPAWFRDADERYSGLELFFDLLFVLAVAQLSRVLDRDPTPGGALLLVLLFVPVWWAWTGFSFATDRFPSDDAVTRLMMLAAAAGAAVMALAVPTASGSGIVAFGLGYGAVRVVLVLFYLRVARAPGHARATARFYAAGFGAAAGVWLLALLLPAPAPARTVVLVVAMLVDLSVPSAASRRGLLIAVDERHLPERFGAFVIIVIGEALTSTALLASEEGIDAARALVLAGDFLLSAALWWGFFDHGSWRRRYRALAEDRGGLLALIVCAYLHFPLVVGVVLAAAGTQIALGRRGGGIGTAAAAALTVGAALYLLALNLMTWAVRVPRRESLAGVRFALIAALAVLLGLGRGLPPAAFVALTAVVLVAHAVVAQLRTAHSTA